MMTTTTFYHEMVQALCVKHNVSKISDIALRPHIISGMSVAPLHTKQYVFRIALVLPAAEPFTRRSEYASVPLADYLHLVKRSDDNVDLSSMDLTRATILNLEILHAVNHTSSRLAVASNIRELERGETNDEEFTSNTDYHAVVPVAAAADSNDIMRAVFASPNEQKLRRTQFRQWGATRGKASLITGSQHIDGTDVILAPADSLLVEIVALEPEHTAKLRAFTDVSSSSPYYILSQQQVKNILRGGSANTQLARYIAYDKTLVDLTKIHLGLIALDDPSASTTPPSYDSIVSLELTVGLQEVKDKQPVLVLRENAIIPPHLPRRSDDDVV